MTLVISYILFQYNTQFLQHFIKYSYQNGLLAHFAHFLMGYNVSTDCHIFSWYHGLTAIWCLRLSLHVVYHVRLAGCDGGRIGVVAHCDFLVLIEALSIKVVLIAHSITPHGSERALGVDGLDEQLVGAQMVANHELNTTWCIRIGWNHVYISTWVYLLKMWTDLLCVDL